MGGQGARPRSGEQPGDARSAPTAATKSAREPPNRDRPRARLRMGTWKSTAETRRAFAPGPVGIREPARRFCSRGRQQRGRCHARRPQRNETASNRTRDEAPARRSGSGTDRNLRRPCRPRHLRSGTCFRSAGVLSDDRSADPQRAHSRHGDLGAICRVGVALQAVEWLLARP